MTRYSLRPEAEQEVRADDGTVDAVVITGKGTGVVTTCNTFAVVFFTAGDEMQPDTNKNTARMRKLA